MNKSNLIRKTYLLEEDTVKRIHALKKDLILLTEVSVIRHAINSLWKEQTKYGRDPFDSDNSNEEDSIVRQANRKIKLQEAEQKIKQGAKDKPKVDLCNELGGTVTENSEGIKVCEYFVHGLLHSEKRIAPLNQLFPNVLSNQWVPSKEIIIKARPDIVKKYNIII